MAFNVRQTIEGSIQIVNNNGDLENIAFCNAMINSEMGGFNITLQVLNKEKYIENIELVKEQYNHFITLVKEKITELGYDLF